MSTFSGRALAQESTISLVSQYLMLMKSLPQRILPNFEDFKGFHAHTLAPTFITAATFIWHLKMPSCSQIKKQQLSCHERRKVDSFDRIQAQLRSNPSNKKQNAFSQWHLCADSWEQFTFYKINIVICFMKVYCIFSHVMSGKFYI